MSGILNTRCISIDVFFRWGGLIGLKDLRLGRKGLHWSAVPRMTKIEEDSVLHFSPPAKIVIPCSLCVE